MSALLLCTEIRFSRLQHYFLFLMVLGIVFGSPTRSVAQGNWPMPGHDAQRTGRANFAGPTTAPTAPAWVFPTAGPIVGDIVTSAEGKLYLASDKLYALNPDGTSFVPAVAIGSAVTGPVVDDIAGLVYVAVSAADGGFDLLSLTKQLQGAAVLFHVPRPPFGGAISPLLLGRGGTVYFVAGRFPGVVYAAGAVQWSNPVCEGESGQNTPFGVSENGPALFNDGSSLVVMCGTPGTSGDLFKLAPFTGVKIASASGGERNLTEPAIDSLNHIHSGWQAFGGAIFCGDYLTWDFSLTLLTPQATFCDSSRFATSRAAVFPDGTSTVRIGFAFPPNNVLVADGAHAWASGTDGSTIPNFSSVPAVDAAGNVFIGNTQGIEALSSVDGHTLWSFSTGDAITTQPVVANGGVLYVGSSSGNVYAFNAVPAAQSGTVYVSGSGAGFATVDLQSASVVANNNSFTDGGVIRVSPDGTRSYVSAIFGLAVVDNATNQVITTVSVGSRPAWIALSPDGSRIYVSQPNISSFPGVAQGVYVIDASTNAVIAIIPVPGPQRIAVAPDNSRIYVGSNGRGIAVIDPATNAITGSISIPGANLTGIAFTPDSAHAYVGEFLGTLYLIDARADSVLQTIPLTGSVGGGIADVVVSPDGHKIYVGNERTSPSDPGHNVFVLDTSSNTVISQIPVSFPSPEMAITTDGANLLVGDSDIGSLIVASTATDSVVEAIHVNDPCCPVISGIGAKPPAASIVPKTGTIVVTTNNAAATFVVSDGSANILTGSGISFTQTAPAATYTITYGAIRGFIPPSSETKILTIGSTIAFSGTYIPLPPAPIVREIAPQAGFQGQLLPAFTVIGANFDSAATLSFSGSGIRVLSYQSRSSSQITAFVQIDIAAAAGLRDLIVTNSDTQQAIDSAAFTVKSVNRFLTFPLRNKAPFTAGINTVFDHSASLQYCPDGVVTAYDGEEGRAEFGVSSFQVAFRDCDGDKRKDPVHGYKNKAKINFDIGGQYLGGGEKSFLFYDGHPGYDYVTRDQNLDGTLCPNGTLCSKSGHTEVLAAADGKIVCAKMAGCPEGPGEIKIDHGNGYFTIYLHLSEFRIKSGPVTRAQVIGISGDTGVKGRPHLHFEVRFKPQNAPAIPVDPYGWSPLTPAADPYIRTLNLRLWE
jgi:YVTN family beta-propeller protein